MNYPDFDISTLWNLTPANFLLMSQKVFEFQAIHNPVYKQWVDLSKQENTPTKGLHQIPFLPITFFKSHPVYIGVQPDTLFESSGTTQDVVSKHWVADINLYEQSFIKCFNLFYGNVSDYCIIGLLPSYLERKHSSLVYMVDKLIQQSGHEQSGFYLNEFENLDKVIKALEATKQKTLLVGVSFALIDFMEAFPQQLQYTTIIETGGMKGRKLEMLKPALHNYLKSGFGTTQIHSEYGMTELLSQAYSVGDGLFRCPPWMKVLIGDEEDPGLLKTVGKGVIHVIDLANIYSCAFIATEDLGHLYEDGSFEILGRMDSSDRRGCSLL
ncbi:MAG: hypothetical protein RLZ16_1076, partial [Bacteroidota bacterium]